MSAIIGPVPTGGDVLMFELARRLARSASIRILTSADGLVQMRAIGVDDVPVTVMDRQNRTHSHSYRYLLRAAQGPYYARRLLDRRVQPRPAMVISSSPFLPDLTTALAARAAGAVWIQSWQLDIPSPRLGYRRAKALPGSASRLPLTPRTVTRAAQTSRIALSYLTQSVMLAAARSWCRLLVVPTPLMAAVAQARGFEASRIHVTGCGVDVKTARGPANVLENSRDDRYDCILLGRFHEQKGLEDVLPIWHRVRQTLPNARLAIVGDGTGPAASAFKAELSRQSDGSVVHLGVLLGDEKYAALRRAKLFMFPSHYESWGHVVIEAMAAGLPTVGYRLPSSIQTFGPAMLTVPMGDRPAFADAIISLLLHKEVYDEYRERGRRLALDYDWDQIAERFASRLWD